MAVSSNETLRLKWNDFEDTVSQAFQNLRTTGDFFDVTLACEEMNIEAHRSILSTCYPIFHNILKLKPNSQPVIFLRGVTHKILVALMDFMYLGEVNIGQDSLAAFLHSGFGPAFYSLQCLALHSKIIDGLANLASEK